MIPKCYLSLYIIIYCTNDVYTIHQHFQQYDVNFLILNVSPLSTNKSVKRLAIDGKWALDQKDNINHVSLRQPNQSYNTGAGRVIKKYTNILHTLTR